MGKGLLRKRGRRAVAVTLVLALTAVAGMSGGADAAKKGGKAKVFAKQQAVNISIPEAVNGAASVPLKSTITVPKKFKGLNVADVNVTGIQTTGSGGGAAGNLIARLTAPNGRTIILFSGKGDQSLGPWTLDDDTATEICNLTTPPCADPHQSLNRPFAGTSNLAGNDSPSWIPLASFDGVKMKGTWTITFADATAAGNDTSILNSWGLRIKPAKAGAS